MTTRLRGAAAALLVLTIVAGVPIALDTLVGWPLPTAMPDWGSVLTTQVSSSVILDVFAVIVWLAWLNFVVCILVEFTTAVTSLRAMPTGRGTPLRANASTPRAPRVPLNLGGQEIARRLVMSIVIGVVGLNSVGGAAAIATPAAAAAPSAAQLGAATSVTDPAPGSNSSPATTNVSPAVAPTTITTADPALLPVYTVEAPGGQGTHHDNLWDIAENHLGDPLRWQEIWNLNEGTVMPDGDRFSRPDLIRPGWALLMPADAVGLAPAADRGAAPAEAPPAPEVGGGQVKSPAATNPSTGAGDIIANPAQTAPAATPETTAQATPTAAGTEEHGAHGVAPAPAVDTASPGAPTAPAGQPPASQPAATQSSPAIQSPSTAGTTTASDQATTSEESTVRTAGGVGALLAAGVLGVIGIRRMRQSARRRAGFRAPRPHGVDAEVEQDLLEVQTPLTLEAIDQGLRNLSAQLAAKNQPLPEIRTARITETDLHLHLQAPARLPSPWRKLTADATQWALPGAGHDADNSTRHADDLAAPWPALVTLGHDDDDAQVLIDLEQTRAFNVCAGEGQDTEFLLNALALELATTPWGDGLRVTLVGCCSDLPALVPSRMRYLDDVDALLAELEVHRSDVHRVLIDSGLADREQDGIAHARQHGVASDVWSPEIILLARPLSSQQHDQLTDLLQHHPRVGIAAVTTGIDNLGSWAMSVLPTNPARATLAPLDLEIRPQRLGGQEYASVLQILATADLEPDVRGEQLFTSSVQEPQLDNPIMTMNFLDLTALDENHPASTSSDVAIDLDSPRSDTADGSDDGVDDAHPAEDLPAGEELDNDQDSAGGHFDGVVEPVGAEHDRAVPAAGSGATHASALLDDALARAGADTRLPLIRILGPVEAERDEQPIELSGRLLAIACYLQLNPGATLDDIGHDFYRKPTAATTVHPRIAELRKAFGAHPETGEQLVPLNTDAAGYRLHQDVLTDWQLLTALAETDDTDNMEAALSLVQGAPFAHVGTRYVRYYHWTADVDARIREVVVDLAITVSNRRYETGAYRRAKQAAAIGLNLEPGQEALRRAHCRALFQLREFEALQTSIEELGRINDEIDSVEDPETIALIDELRAHGLLRVA